MAAYPADPGYSVDSGYHRRISILPMDEAPWALPGGRVPTLSPESAEVPGGIDPPEDTEEMDMASEDVKALVKAVELRAEVAERRAAEGDARYERLVTLVMTTTKALLGGVFVLLILATVAMWELFGVRLEGAGAVLEGGAKMLVVP